MSRSCFMHFLKDEQASVTMEYLALTGILGIGWITAGTEYRDQLIQAYEKVARDLSSIDLR